MINSRETQRIGQFHSDETRSIKMYGTGRDEEVGDDTFTLVDVCNVLLDELPGLPATVFGSSMRRLMDEVMRPQQVVAGWNSAM